MKGYKEITEEILNMLQHDVVPWRQHWATGMPANAITKRQYRGINVWLLSNHNYNSNLWLTYNQTKELGGYVRRGEKGRAIVFWKMLEIEDDDGETDMIPMLRLYTVFNIQQTSIIMESKTAEFDPIESAKRVVDGYMDKPPIITGEPCYLPDKDIITMPAPTTFDSPEHYYSTLYHELSHSTGASRRLNRNIKNSYANDPYAEEELIAEMSAAYLAGIAGTEVYAKTIDNSTAYIRHWIERFQNNDKLIVRLSSQAQKASDWVLGNGHQHDVDAISADDDTKPMLCCNCDKSQFVKSESSWYCLDREQFTDGECPPQDQSA